MDIQKQLDAEQLKNSKLKEKQQILLLQIRESDSKMKKLKEQIEKQEELSGIKRIKAKGFNMEDILKMIEEKERLNVL